MGIGIIDNSDQMNEKFSSKAAISGLPSATTLLDLLVPDVLIVH
jgi:hypothetical protein